MTTATDCRLHFTTTLCTTVMSAALPVCTTVHAHLTSCSTMHLLTFHYNYCICTIAITIHRLIYIPPQSISLSNLLIFKYFLHGIIKVREKQQFSSPVCPVHIMN